MPRCQKCGAFLEADSAFCTVCGTPVSDQTNISTNNTKKDAQKKKNSVLLPILLVIGILVASILVFIGAFFISGGKLSLGSGRDSEKSEKTRKEREDSEEKESVTDDIKADTVEEEAQVTPTPDTVRPENVSISFCETAPYLGDYYKLSVAASGATSYLIQEGVDHPNTADMVLDGNEISSWQEGVSGDGLGEAIWFDFPQEQRVKYLSFKLGNWRDLNNWTGNNRPARISITIGDYQCAVSFPDEQREFWIELSEPYPASQIRFQIDSVHQGAKWDDTCIAEIGIYGE